MGQKVNPHGARVGVILDWSTKWYAGKKDFSNNLIEDYNIRKAIPKMIEETTKKSARDLIPSCRRWFHREPARQIVHEKYIHRIKSIRLARS